MRNVFLFQFNEKKTVSQRFLIILIKKRCETFFYFNLTKKKPFRNGFLIL